MTEKKRPQILIMSTGSVACIKLPELVSKLHSAEAMDIKLAVTEHALHFFSPPDLPPDVMVFRDLDEWTTWKGRGDPVLHVELRKWATIGLIAPLDANTLAKVANGISDNLVTSVLRAWDMQRPLIFCPAMNTCMWNHPLTQKHLKVLEDELHFQQVPPVEKELMCGDKGIGAMANVEDIVKAVLCIWDASSLNSKN
ncbi:unnamed protein product [Darwinula stevensoni]|uniref:Flavoprotein domain-containing protein n=1 Tax=Darwinula stevensoni TaxID=69355 RepID=A0A7R9A5H6_9CRUS|nr:unnamed protein product [Darwinula stevensoni]CAG0885329.1 unnamed protein product [Darwinula stevensoni]